MTRTLTVEGTVTTVDTSTNLTTQGSVTAPSLVVPAGVTMIKKIIAAAAPDFVTNGSAGFFIRLNGAAVQNGEQVLAIGAAGGQDQQAGADPAPAPPVLFIMDETDIPVTASDTITISAEMAGDDLGSSKVVVTIVFA